MAGGVLRRAIWFDEWPADLRVKIVALDPSKGSDARRGDYSALVMLGVDAEGMLYVEADLARRPTPRDGGRRARNCAGSFRPDVFGVETNQFQDLLAGEFEAEFRRQGILGVQPWSIDNRVNKQVRIRRLGPYLSSRRLRFKSRLPGTRLLVEQFERVSDRRSRRRARRAGDGHPAGGRTVWPVGGRRRPGQIGCRSGGVENQRQFDQEEIR